MTARYNEVLLYYTLTLCLTTEVYIEKGYAACTHKVDQYKTGHVYLGAKASMIKKTTEKTVIAGGPSLFLSPSWEQGGGDNSNIQMSGCVCWVSENRPILNDTFTCKTYTYCGDSLHNP